MARRIIIDTDPGQDDAVAILLALASPELEVLGITVVAGNVPLPLTLRNTCQIVELAGRPDVPIHAGCDRPLARPLVTARQVADELDLTRPMPGRRSTVSRASFLAWAVPEEPETMAPARPMVLPSGAVKPAT